VDDKLMRQTVDQVLADLDAAELEQRIAPVKCEKNPEAPECQMHTLYGVTDYGISEP
jgi:hypothetical protein